MLEKPDSVVPHPVNQCAGCGSSLTGQAPDRIEPLPGGLGVLRTTAKETGDGDRAWFVGGPTSTDRIATGCAGCSRDGNDSFDGGAAEKTESCRLQQFSIDARDRLS